MNHGKGILSKDSCLDRERRPIFQAYIPSFPWPLIPNPSNKAIFNLNLSRIGFCHQEFWLLQQPSQTSVNQRTSHQKAVLIPPPQGCNQTWNLSDLCLPFSTKQGTQAVSIKSDWLSHSVSYKYRPEGTQLVKASCYFQRCPTCILDPRYPKLRMSSSLPFLPSPILTRTCAPCSNSTEWLALFPSLCWDANSE